MMCSGEDENEDGEWTGRPCENLAMWALPLYAYSCDKCLGELLSRYHRRKGERVTIERIQ